MIMLTAIINKNRMTNVLDVHPSTPTLVNSRSDLVNLNDASEIIPAQHLYSKRGYQIWQNNPPAKREPGSQVQPVTAGHISQSLENANCLAVSS